jgi:hypothetical protein
MKKKAAGAPPAGPTILGCNFTYTPSDMTIEAVVAITRAIQSNTEVLLALAKSMGPLPSMLEVKSSFRDGGKNDE